MRGRTLRHGLAERCFARSRRTYNVQSEANRSALIVGGIWEIVGEGFLGASSFERERVRGSRFL